MEIQDRTIVLLENFQQSWLQSGKGCRLQSAFPLSMAHLLDQD
jgi:hypothetical protein